MFRLFFVPGAACRAPLAGDPSAGLIAWCLLGVQHPGLPMPPRRAPGWPITSLQWQVLLVRIRNAAPCARARPTPAPPQGKTGRHYSKFLPPHMLAPAEAAWQSRDTTTSRLQASRRGLGIAVV